MDENFEGRVFVVANRLPITIKPQNDGRFEFNMSSGGLVSGLRSLSKAVDFKWIGWPGIDVHRNDKDTLRRELQDQYNAVPIFLTKDQAEGHYNGFSSLSACPLYSHQP
jgi:trehalose 6-phosphate synthase